MKRFKIRCSMVPEDFFKFSDECVTGFVRLVISQNNSSNVVVVPKGELIEKFKKLIKEGDGKK